MILTHGSNSMGYRNLDFSKLTIKNLDDDIYISEGSLASNSVNGIQLGVTPTINLSQLDSSKYNQFHYEYSIGSYAQDDFSIGMGEWITNDMHTRDLFSIMHTSNFIRYSYSIPGSESMTETDISTSYTLNTRIIVDITTSGNNFKLVVKYGSAIVLDTTVPISDISLSNSQFRLGGLRFDYSQHVYRLSGKIFIDKCYFILNDELVWGIH